MNIKRITAALLSAAMCAGLSACAAKEQNADALGDNAAETEKVTVVLDWTPNTNHTGLYAAVANGYFADEGIEVEIKEPPEDGATLLVASGKAQFGFDFQEYLAPVYKPNEELGVTAVASIIQHNTSGLISLKDKGIASPSDLEGHSYASWDMDIEKAILKYLMEKENADYGKLNIIPNTVTDVASALLNDQADTVWVYYAWDGIAAEVKGIETNFIDFGKIDKNLDFYSPVLIGNDEYLKNNTETAKAFLRALKKGYEYAMQNPEDAAKILCAAVPELDEETVVKSQQWLADKYAADAEYWGYIDAERWDGFYKWLYDSGVIDYEIKPGVGFSNDYIEAN